MSLTENLIYMCVCVCVRVKKRGQYLSEMLSPETSTFFCRLDYLTHWDL